MPATVRIPRLTEPLSDGAIALREPAEHDIPEILIAHDRDPELHLRRGLARPPSGAELGRRLEEDAQRRREGSDAELTVVADLERDVCVGQVVVHGIDWTDRRAELGLWLAPDARGRGVGRAALALVTPWLFSTLGLERVQILTEVDNAPMLACAAAAGFVREGVLRGYSRLGRGRCDEVVLSLLPSELDRRP